MSRTSRSININDGRLVFRTAATDELKALYKPVDDEVAKAIYEGKIDAMKVVNAIMEAERYSKEFSWKEFKRQESILNIRQNDVDLQDEEKPEELEEDKPGDVLSLKDVLGRMAEDGKPDGGKPGKKNSRKQAGDENEPDSGE